MSAQSKVFFSGLAYVGVETPDFERWRTVGPGVFGFEALPDAGDATVLLRCDDRHHRLAFSHGDRHRLAFVGWDVADDATLDELAERLAARGIAASEGDAALLARRHVTRLLAFEDPFGIRHEAVVGAAAGFEWKPGRPMVGRFVTGDAGAGHVVMIAPDIERFTEFFSDVLGFRLSDTIYDFTELRFFHTNARHHSLAAAHIPGAKGLHHIMLEVSELDDVGIAYDALATFGIPITMTLGRHPNDRMLSFYCRVPGGFEIEYGWGGLRIEQPETWTAASFDHISEWGHKPQELDAPGAIEPFVSRETVRSAR